MTDSEPAISTRLDSLISFVPTGTTEGERAILRSAFVQAEEYATIITPPAGSPRLLLGKKGSGKSAVIDFSTHLLDKSGIPNITLVPMDLDLTNWPTDSSLGSLTRHAYEKLMLSVAETIGTRLEGYLHGDNAILYKAAVDGGARPTDRMSKAAKLLANISQPFTQVDLSAVLSATNSATQKQLQDAIRSNIETSKNAFYIFLDDVDQVASPDESAHLNRIWAFLLAARRLSEQVQKIRCVISMRDEIWRSLTNQKAGQRDQADHFLSLIYRLNPSLDHVQQIIERRLELAAESCGTTRVKDPYTPFFEGQWPHMPTSTKTSSWADLIRSRSRGRPRDAVQLVRALAVTAKEQNSRITENIFASVMPAYSADRAKLLSNEFEDDCSSLSAIIDSFAEVEYDSGSFSASTEIVRQHLSTLPSRFSIVLNGTAIKPGDEKDVIRIWSFLYSVGLIYPRVSDSRERQDYRHITPEDQPKFVSSANWNKMQGALWEVHPAFRDHLIEVQKDNNASSGLARKARRRRRS